MKNIMTINNVKAFIQYDPDIEMFRGEFIGLNGGADFYANNITDLKKEAEISLNVFLETCQQEGIEPYKNYSGKFNVRIPQENHEKAVLIAKSQGISLNDVADKAIAMFISSELAQ